MTWYSKRRTNDLNVILFEICSFHVPEEVEPPPFNTRRNWRATDSLPVTVAFVNYVDWSLTALTAQFRSYCTFKVELYCKY